MFIFRTFYTAIEHIERANSDVLSSALNPDHAVASDFLEAWLNLAEKLINASAILESSHTLPVPPPPPSCRHSKKLNFNPLFNPLDFILKAQNVRSTCIVVGFIVLFIYFYVRRYFHVYRSSGVL